VSSGHDARGTRNLTGSQKFSENFFRNIWNYTHSHRTGYENDQFQRAEIRKEQDIQLLRLVSMLESSENYNIVEWTKILCASATGWRVLDDELILGARALRRRRQERLNNYVRKTATRKMNVQKMLSGRQTKKREAIGDKKAFGEAVMFANPFLY
jgi:hypothetical protein